MKDAILLIILGIFFGLFLQKTQLSKYSTIVNVFRFKDLTVIKFMMSALATAMVGVFLLRDLGWITMSTLTPTYIIGNLVGGLIFGVGMAWGGF